MSRSWLALLAPFALLPACTTDVDETARSEAAVSDAPIAWSPCAVAGPAGGAAECATIDVPLVWSNPTGRQIKLFVKRIRGSAPGPHKQLWLLAGGPGSPGESFDYQRTMFQQLDPALDLYIPDHRGTGRSTLLECPNAGWDMAACGRELVAAYGRDGLAGFSTTDAAHDVGHVVARTREPGQQVHVYGVSYGTYLAQRYLQLFPQQPTTITLDGVCQAGLCSMLKYAYWSDSVAQKFMRECGTDPFCSSKLGPDPNARAKEAVAAVDTGRCTAFGPLTGAQVQGLLLGLSRSLFLRPLIPAIVYRVLRCNDQDAIALQNLLTRLTGGGAGGFDAAPAAPVRGSQALTFNIAFSEMMETPAITRDGLQTLMRDSVYATYSPAMHELFDAWPRYDHDEYVGAYPQSDVPVLLLNGTLDSATPIEFAEEVAAHYTRPNQTFVTFPRGTHGTFYGTPTDTGRSCALGVFAQFLAAPTQPLDTSCIGRILPHAFAGDPATAQRLFGTDDFYENPKPATRRTTNERDDEVDDELRRISNDGAPFFSTR